MSAGDTTLRVATWNVRAALGPGPFPGSWWNRVDARRLDAIGDAVAALHADVVALQECAVLSVDGRPHDTAGAIATRTGMSARFAATRHFLIAATDGRVLGAGLFGNAIMSRLPIGDSRTYGLPMAPLDALVEPATAGHPLAGVRYADAPGDVREPRCLLVAAVAGDSVGSVHLSHVGSAERALQAFAVAEVAPSVLLGDLNAPIEADELRALRDGWIDGFAAVGVPISDPRRATTQDGQRIDHILVRGDAFGVLECRRVDDVGWLSDHLPVVATLAPSDRSARRS